MTVIPAPSQNLFKRHRYSLLSLLMLIICCATIVAVIFTGARGIDEVNLSISRAHALAAKEQSFSLRTERMVASMRGYALLGKPALEADYQQAKAEASDLMAELSDFVAGDPAQTLRVKEQQHYFLLLSERLDGAGGDAAPAEGAKPARRGARPVAEAPQDIESLRDNLTRTSKDILLGAQQALDRSLEELDHRRTFGRLRNIACCFLTAVVFMLLNVYFARSRLEAARQEEGLEDAESVFRLAIEGSNDGFFEWNLPTETAFYSKQFCAMLGYEAGQLPPTLQTFRELLHPDDREKALEHIDKFLRGEVPEYLFVYRLRHKTGRWVWVNGRGKALYGVDGKPTRLVGAHTDITHIKAYEEKLEKAKEFAEKANRAKTEFLAHMSHEIRTPLTAISGIAEIFSMTQESFNDKQQQLIKALSSSTASLKDLVNDILDFSKIESGELELEDKPFRLLDLFDQVVAIFEHKAQEKGIHFSFDAGGLERQIFHGDRVRLRQILINLIGNAIKFTNQGGVTVTAARSPDPLGGETLRIEVRDTGIGIDPAQFTAIFERFRQADSSVSRKYGGTGLGLPISLRLARLMGGDINVASAPGQGSTFTLGVPIRQRMAEEGFEAPAPLETQDPDPSMPDGISKKRVLLVEDYEGNIIILSYLLENMQCAYDVARTGLEALNKWKETGYDLILMDVQMPEMDGFTATAQIRRMEEEKKLPRTPIIGMTAHALVGDKEKCIESGMDAYLAKPIIEADLKARIVEYLNAGRSRPEA